MFLASGPRKKTQVRPTQVSPTPTDPKDLSDSNPRDIKPCQAGPITPDPLSSAPTDSGLQPITSVYTHSQPESCSQGQACAASKGCVPLQSETHVISLHDAWWWMAFRWKDTWNRKLIFIHLIRLCPLFFFSDEQTERFQDVQMGVATPKLYMEFTSTEVGRARCWCKLPCISSLVSHFWDGYCISLNPFWSGQ